MVINGGKTILQKLLHIQQSFKAPKDKYNSFGKYKYRSAESMIEAVKPLLAETGTAILFNCESKEAGGHVRIEVDAYLVHPESGEYVSVHCSCREDEQRAGMCASQNSGSTESFAKKYALGDLLLVDDSKDADDENLSSGGQSRRTNGNVPSRAPKDGGVVGAPAYGSDELKRRCKEVMLEFCELESVKSMDKDAKMRFFKAKLKAEVGKDDPTKLTMPEWDKVSQSIDFMKVEG